MFDRVYSSNCLVQFISILGCCVLPLGAARGKHRSAGSETRLGSARHGCVGVRPPRFPWSRLPRTSASRVSHLVELRVIKDSNLGDYHLTNSWVVEDMDSSFSRSGELGKSALATGDRRCLSPDSGFARHPSRGVHQPCRCR
jgi:hypothetical protein